MKKTFVIILILIVLGFATYGFPKVFEYFNFKHLQSQCYQKIKTSDITITAYFLAKYDVSKIRMIASDLQSLQQVHSVSVQSADEALQVFARIHANDPVIQQGLKELKTNSLESSLWVNIGNDQDVSSTMLYINQKAQEVGITVDIQKTNQSKLQRQLEVIPKFKNIPETIKYLKDCISATSSYFY